MCVRVRACGRVCVCVCARMSVCVCVHVHACERGVGLWTPLPSAPLRPHICEVAPGGGRHCRPGPFPFHSAFTRACDLHLAIGGRIRTPPPTFTGERRADSSLCLCLPRESNPRHGSPAAGVVPVCPCWLQVYLTPEGGNKKNTKRRGAGAPAPTSSRCGPSGQAYLCRGSSNL